MLLAAFVLVPLILPWLARRIGARVFYVAAVLPIAAFAQANARSGGDKRARSNSVRSTLVQATPWI